MNKHTAFITFAGSPGEVNPAYAEIEKARDRLEKQAKSSEYFEKVIALNWKDLSETASAYSITLPKNPHRYLFTPIILRLISLGAFGNFKYFLYAGSGCELNNNKFARSDLSLMKRNCDKQLFHVEHTLLCEVMYSKKEVLNYFNVPSSDYLKPQIMATFFMVSPQSNPEKLDQISRAWLDACLIDDGFLVSDMMDPSLQDSRFVAPRNDQSILSITLKRNGIKSVPEKQRNFARNFSALRGSRVMIWTPRNRTGKSVLPGNVTNSWLGFLMVLLSPIANLIHRARTNYRFAKILSKCQQTEF